MQCQIATNVYKCSFSSKDYLDWLYFIIAIEHVLVFTAISGEELNLTPQAQENEANISEGEVENLIDFQRKVRLAIQEGIYFDIIQEQSRTKLFQCLVPPKLPLKLQPKAVYQMPIMRINLLT